MSITLHRCQVLFNVWNQASLKLIGKMTRLKDSQGNSHRECSGYAKPNRLQLTPSFLFAGFLLDFRTQGSFLKVITDFFFLFPEGTFNVRVISVPWTCVVIPLLCLLGSWFFWSSHGFFCAWCSSADTLCLFSVSVLAGTAMQAAETPLNPQLVKKVAQI